MAIGAVNNAAAIVAFRGIVDDWKITEWSDGYVEMYITVAAKGSAKNATSSRRVGFPAGISLINSGNKAYSVQITPEHNGLLITGFGCYDTNGNRAKNPTDFALGFTQRETAWYTVFDVVVRGWRNI